MSEAKVAVGRLQRFLELPEYQHPVTANKNFTDSGDKGESEESISIKIENGNLAWPRAVELDQPNKKSGKKNGKNEKDEEEKLEGENLPYVPCLYDIELEVKQGQLLGVAGPVGGGKSSLIGAIMGEV